MIIEKSVLKKVEESDIVNGTVVIPNKVRVIGDEAFANCGKLKKIEIPNTVNAIGKKAFASCTKLRSVKLPNNLKEIQDETFKNCSMLFSIDIPDTVKSIGTEAFAECSFLGKVKLSSNLENIESKAFYKCLILPKINLPNSLKKIGNGAFYYCNNLRSIDIPPQITRIPSDAFRYCDKLKKVTIPEGVTEIGDNAFFLCTVLNHVTLPESLKEIGRGSFKDCKKLTEISIPKKVERIGAEAFDDCYSLSRVTLSEGLKFIGDEAFAGCYWLKNIHLPNSLENIGDGVFYFCTDLRSIRFPENIKTIPKRMFHYCTGLKEITIPEGVTKIDSRAFLQCKRLKKVNLPNTLEEIDLKAFEQYGFSNIVLPSSLKTIGDSAFLSCSNLNNLTIPEGVETLNANIVMDCKKIKSLTIPNTVKKFKNPNESYFTFVENTDNGFIVSGKETENTVPMKDINVSVPLFFKLKDKNPEFIREQKNDLICDFYETFIPNLTDAQLDEFMQNHNFTFFKQIMKQKPAPGYIDHFNKDAFYTGFYNLGGLTPIETFKGGKRIDYAQKVTGKLLEFIQNDDWRPYEKLSKAFDGMNIEGFKRDYTDFFISNIPDIMREVRYNEEFVSRSYNEFEEIQATNTNDHGSQRQLKPTMEKFKSYFKESSFRNVTPETKPIADMIAPYFDTQKDFVNAVNIMNEFKEKNVSENILSTPLYEEKPFENIDKMAEGIEELQTSALRNMTQAATDQFTYEWLAKNDPTNLILGKLCSCCAHLRGAGYGIMHASIVHPNVQNLVVRDDDGRIFAKSTLYINPDEQFGVLNNFEVNNGSFGDYKEKAYIHFMKGIKDFAEQYNKEHPDKPLKQINVGGNLNDLMTFVKKYNKEAPELLKALNYSTYGTDEHRYAGDSYKEQYVVWENENLLNEKENKTENVEVEKEN